MMASYGPGPSASATAEAEYERYLAIARPHLDEATLNAAWEEGKAMTLEQAIEWIGDDEYVEITPNNIRLRKKILEANERNRASKKKAEPVS